MTASHDYSLFASIISSHLCTYHRRLYKSNSTEPFFTACSYTACEARLLDGAVLWYPVFLAASTQERRRRFNSGTALTE
jgi:hypothetical protein